MELLFVVLISAALGLIARYVVPGRQTYGIALLPALSAAVSAIVWVALLWLVNWKFDGGWIWVVSLVVGPVAALIVAVILPAKRTQYDHALFARLSGARA